MKMETRGSLTKPSFEESPREIFLLQRKDTKVGKELGKTTGFGHRASLTKRKVKMLNGCSYVKVTDKGLLISRKDKEQLLEVDNIIVCAGQVPFKELQDPLLAAGINVHLIGGADVAAELDAKRAIKQASELAARI
jgi:2,4-dienoyl-CoA reductase (NADPH2)